MADYTYRCLQCGTIFVLDEYELDEEPTCPLCFERDYDIIKRGCLDGVVYNCT
jgi:hypothetical protein